MKNQVYIQSREGKLPLIWREEKKRYSKELFKRIWRFTSFGAPA